MESRLLNILYFILQEIIERDVDVFEEQDSIRESLVTEGYNEEEIDLVLVWLENYFNSFPDKPRGETKPALQSAPRGMRILSFDEKMLIAPEAYGFLLGLESKGLISTDTIEEIIHRSMNMFEEIVGIEEMKIVTLLTIFEQGSGNLNDIVKLVDGTDLKYIH